MITIPGPLPAVLPSTRNRAGEFSRLSPSYALLSANVSALFRPGVSLRRFCITPNLALPRRRLTSPMIAESPAKFTCLALMLCMSKIYMCYRQLRAFCSCPSYPYKGKDVGRTDTPAAASPQSHNLPQLIKKLLQHFPHLRPYTLCVTNTSSLISFDLSHSFVPPLHSVLIAFAHHHLSYTTTHQPNVKQTSSATSHPPQLQ